MKKRLHPKIGAQLASEGLSPEASLKEKLLAIFHSNRLINSLVAVAITIGFLHGWLKIHWRHPATTFLFDGVLALALALVFFRVKRTESFIPKGKIGGALKAFYLVCFIYLLLPLGPPLLVSAAAIRGWCFSSLMFCLGYHLTKSVPQIRGYFYVLVLLGLITSLYGLQQTPEEIEKQMLVDQEFAERYKFSFYATERGRQLRIFSTFVSSGAFGGTMAYATVFAIVLLTDARAGNRERWLLLAALIPIAYGMILSGARSALLTLAFGFLVIAWFRRNFLNFVLIPACLLLTLKIAADVTGGAAMDRYRTLLDLGDIYHRNYIPTWIGWQYMKDNLLGGGLGRSGYSVPFFLLDRTGFTDFVAADGDLGRLMIELGLVGVLFFGALLWIALRTVFKILRDLRDSPLSTVALASAACFVMALASFPNGSPFLGIPMGAIVWFLLGTLQKLSDHSELITRSSVIAAGAEPAASGKRFLYHRRDKIASKPPGQS